MKSKNIASAPVLLMANTMANLSWKEGRQEADKVWRKR